MNMIYLVNIMDRTVFQDLSDDLSYSRLLLVNMSDLSRRMMKGFELENTLPALQKDLTELDKIVNKIRDSEEMWTELASVREMMKTPVVSTWELDGSGAVNPK
jgi:hypothetical protein